MSDTFKIKRLRSGATPTLLDADKGNELIDRINGMLSSRGIGPIKVAVAEDGEMTVSFEARPMVVVLCVDGQPRRKVIFVQDQATD
jgi:hypothetical protein